MPLPAGWDIRQLLRPRAEEPPGSPVGARWGYLWNRNRYVRGRRGVSQTPGATRRDLACLELKLGTGRGGQGTPRVDPFLGLMDRRGGCFSRCPRTF